MATNGSCNGVSPLRRRVSNGSCNGVSPLRQRFSNGSCNGVSPLRQRASNGQLQRRLAVAAEGFQRQLQRRLAVAAEGFQRAVATASRRCGGGFPTGSCNGVSPLRRRASNGSCFGKSLSKKIYFRNFSSCYFSSAPLGPCHRGRRRTPGAAGARGYSYRAPLGALFPKTCGGSPSRPECSVRLKAAHIAPFSAGAPIQHLSSAWWWKNRRYRAYAPFLR